MDNRRSFIQKLVAGVFAAPAIVPISASGKLPSSTDQVSVREWDKDGIHFKEFTMPKTTPPHFHVEGDPLGGRYVMLQPFDWTEMEKSGKTRGQIVKACIDKFDNSSAASFVKAPEDGEVVARHGSRGRGMTWAAKRESCKYVTIVRVHGMDNIMAVAATGRPLVPRLDYYSKVAVPPMRYATCLSGTHSRWSRGSLPDPEKTA
jgi:hypothetical protein